MSAFIYFQTERSGASILDGLAEHLGLTVDPVLSAMESDEFDLDLRVSEDATDGIDPVTERHRYREFDSYALVTLEESLDEAHQVAIVRRVLEWFWIQGIPAVTESDFDDRLPFGGGNEPESIPWAER